MKKYIYVPILLILLFLMLILFSKDFRIYITQPLRVENLEIINSLNLNEIELKIPREVQEKFDLIYSKYDTDYSSKKYKLFVNYLNKNNAWEKAKLTHLNITYNVLIKLHGNSPTQHIENDHYSLGIKMLDNKKINESSRFNLIVYWRIRQKHDLIKYLSQKMGIYQTEKILSKVRINNKPEKLYYFEFRTNREYLKKIKKSDLIVLKHKSDHSLIYTGGDIEFWNKKLKKVIKKTDFNDSLKILISNNYLRLNKAIYEQDLNMTIACFDMKYLAKVQAFRYLFGDNGHGFGLENLLVAFNTSNLKFYPFVHRDNSQYNSFTLPKINDHFRGTEILGTAGPLFHIISKSDLLAEETKKYLTKILSLDFINEYSIDSIVKTHDSYYYSGVLKRRLNLNQPDQSILNLETLRAKLVKYSKK